MATLTYVYADQTAVLGRLSTHAEPHSYDLCAEHAEGLTVPRGWEVVRLVADFDPDPSVADRVDALVDAVNRTEDPTPALGEPGSAPRSGLRIVP